MFGVQKFLQNTAFQIMKRCFGGESKDITTNNLHCNNRILNSLLSVPGIITAESLPIRSFLRNDLLSRISSINMNEFQPQILKPFTEFGYGVVIQKSLSEPDCFELSLLHQQAGILGNIYEVIEPLCRLTSEQVKNLKVSSQEYLNSIDNLSIFNTPLHYEQHRIDPCDHLFIVPATGAVEDDYKELLNLDHNPFNVTIMQQGPDLLARNVESLVQQLCAQIMDQHNQHGKNRFVIHGDSRACMVILEACRRIRLINPDIKFVLSLNDPTPGNIGFNGGILNNSEIPSNVEACTLYYNAGVFASEIIPSKALTFGGINDKIILQVKDPSKTFLSVRIRPSATHIHVEPIHVGELLDSKSIETGVFVHGDVNREYDSTSFRNNGTPNQTLINMLSRSYLFKSTYDVTQNRYKSTQKGFTFSGGAWFENGRIYNADVSGYKSPWSEFTYLEATFNKNGVPIGPTLIENKHGQIYLLVYEVNGSGKFDTEADKLLFVPLAKDSPLGYVESVGGDEEFSDEITARKISKQEDFIDHCKEKIEEFRNERNRKYTPPSWLVNKDYI